MNVEIRQYEPGDELLIDGTVEDRPVENPDYWKIWKESIKPEQTWTITANGNPVAIGGFWPYQEDGDAVIVWLTVVKDIPAKMFFVRVVKTKIDDFLKQYKRVEAIIRDSFFLGPRWMKFLGFQPGNRWIRNGRDLGAQIYVKESESGFSKNVNTGAGRRNDCLCGVELS